MPEEIAAADDIGADEIETATADEEAEAVEETPEATDEADETESTDEADDESGEDADDESDDDSEEEIELDYGGNKFRLPKGSIPEEVATQLDEYLKGSWRSHTEKSMELAEQRKALEAERSVVQELSSLRGELLEKFSHGQAIKNEIAELEQIDLQALWQSSPDEARQVSDYLSAKKSELGAIVNEVSDYERKAHETQAEFVARQDEQGKELVFRQVPEFKAREADVIDYAVKNYGVSEADAKQWGMNPAGAMMAYKAMLYDQSQEAAKKAAKPKPAQAKPVKPVKGKASARPNLDIVRDADKMSAEQWLAARNRQLKQRA